MLIIKDCIMRTTKPKLSRLLLWTFLVAYLLGTHFNVIAQTTYASTANKKNNFSVYLNNADDKFNQPNEKLALLTVLKELNRKKGAYFLFSDPGLGNKPVNSVSIDEKTQTDKILDQALKNTGLKYKKVNPNTFVILQEKDNARKIEAQPVNFQEGIEDHETSVTPMHVADVITGTVTDADGAPVAGVSVTIKGTSRGTVTNASGIFTIEANKGDVLVFSSVNYTTQELTVGDNNNLSITLALSATQMNEVVVTALGIRREKRSLGYSVQDIKGDKLTLARENNLANSLSGKIAGLQISRTGNGPGGSSRIIIRGNNSVSGNNQPLVVVDGIPMENEQTATDQSEFGNSYDKGDGISQINPDDVESVSVLKGPAAAALYGSRGGNGVILITTKKGSSRQGFGITVNSNYTMETPLLYPDVQNEYSQGTLGQFDTTSTASWGAKITGQQVKDWTGQTRPLRADGDDLKNFLRKGKTITNSVELSGGNSAMNFRLGYTNLYNEGLLPNSTIKRNQVTLRAGSDINKYLTADVKVSYSRQEAENRPQGSGTPQNIFAQYYARPRTVHFSDMTRYKDDQGRMILWYPTGYSTMRNPYWVLNEDHNADETDRLLSMISLDFKITSWLKLKLRHGMDFGSRFETDLDAYGIAESPTDPKPNFRSNYYELRTRRVETNADFLLSANKTFKDLSLGLSVGGNRLNERSNASGATTGELDFPGAVNVRFGELPRPLNITPIKRRVNSIYVFANVGFRNYAFIDATFRNDWSSTLSVDDRSFNYPSISGSLIVNDFFEDITKSSFPEFINYVKLRAGFAKAGNTIPPYSLIPYFSIYRDNRNVPILQRPTIKPNPNTLPEIVKSQEYGIDLRLFNSRVGLDFTIYKKNAFNQILAVKSPAAEAQGYTDGEYINAGNVENKGYEFVLTGNPIRTKSGLNWDIVINYNHNENRVIKLHPDIKQIFLQSDVSSRAIIIVAEEGELYGNLYGRDFKYDAQGRLLVDTTGLPTRGEQKNTLLGNYQPKYTMGISNTLSFKGFSFSFLIDIRKGGVFYSQSVASMHANGNAKGTLAYRDGGLIVDGVLANGAKNTRAITAQQYWTSVAGFEPRGASLFTYDASNTRLREVTLGYSIPTSVLGKLPFRTVRIDLVGRNLWLIKSHIPGVDPESAFSTTNAQGWEHGAYPSTKSYGVNLKLEF